MNFKYVLLLIVLITIFFLAISRKSDNNKMVLNKPTTTNKDNTSANVPKRAIEIPAMKQAETTKKSITAEAPIAVVAKTNFKQRGKATAIATFESIGITLAYQGDDNKNATCNVKFRQKGTKAWQEGYPLWRDDESKEFRGSLVHLNPGSTYDIKLAPQDDQYAPAEIFLSADTWNETFPIAKTITIPAGNKTVNIDQSGTPKGYILYTAPKGKNTIDVKNKADLCLNVSAQYVIIRGMNLKGAKRHLIRLFSDNDIVIENCTFSNWGSSEKDGWGKNMDCAIYSNNQKLKRVTIQRNTFSNPRYGSNNWKEPRPSYKKNPHPAGPQVIGFWSSEGNHVMRYNHAYSSLGHYYNDVFGCGSNNSKRGFPNADTDIYGNIIEDSWDDGIEAEGANRNVRIWGNYLKNIYKGIATRSTSIGPLYIWRNVCELGYQSPKNPGGTSFHKAGMQRSEWDNGVYDFNNTVVLPPNAKTDKGTRGIEGAMLYTTTTNNIIMAEKPIVCEKKKSYGNRYINDLYYGKTYNLNFALESKHISGKPTFTSAFGINKKTGKGIFSLSAQSKGYNQGIKIPNFTDNCSDGLPDIGAHEAGTAPMEFGPLAYLKK